MVFTFSKSGDQIIELDAEQVGDVLSINTETGELMKNGEPTGWFATKNVEDKNCIKIGEDGCWQLLQDDGTYKSTNIPVSGVTAAQNTETKQWTLTIVDAQGNFYGYFTVNEYKSKRAEFNLVLIIYKYYKQIREDVSEWYDEIFSY